MTRRNDDQANPLSNKWQISIFITSGSLTFGYMKEFIMYVLYFMGMFHLSSDYLSC